MSMIPTSIKIGDITTTSKLDGQLHITKNFQLYELANNKARDYIKLLLSGDVERFAELMQALRDKFGRIVVNSWYRTPSYNASLPGAIPNSLHLKGTAADIGTPDFWSRDSDWSSLMHEVSYYAIQQRAGYELIRYKGYVHIALDFDRPSYRYVADRRT